MKLSKKGKNVIFSELNITPDIRNFITCQIPMTISFDKMGIEIGSLNIGNRSIINKNSMIEVNNKMITRDECINQIRNLCQDGIPNIIVDSDIVTNKNDLFELLTESKQFLKEYLMYGIIDYENNMLSIKMPNFEGGTKETEDIYFWNTNIRTTYAFKAKEVAIYPDSPSSHSLTFFLYGTK